MFLAHPFVEGSEMVQNRCHLGMVEIHRSVHDGKGSLVQMICLHILTLRI